MTPDQNLRWGEHYLANSYHSVRVSFSNQLHNDMKTIIARIPGLQWRSGKPSKTGIIKWVLYGIVNENDYRKYLIIKQEAQAKLLINKAASLLNQVKDHKTTILHAKTKELVPEEPFALDR